MAVLKSNMIFIFKCWGVQRKPSSFPEVYIKLRDEKNREIICIYTIDDVLDEEKNLKDFIHDVVFDIASDYISCDDEWLKDVKVSDKRFEEVQDSMNKLIVMDITLGEFLEKWEHFEFKLF